MRIIITEDQLKNIVESQKPSLSSHPSEDFDKLYGTKLSKRYDFSPYTEKELQHKWDMAVHHDKRKEFESCFPVIKTAFPYVDYKKLNDQNKYDILCGMLSRFNPEDIVHFAVHRVYGFMNVEQHRLAKQLPPEVAYNMQWVMSPHTQNLIKAKFSIM